MRDRVGVIHPHLRPAGGSEARALWIAEALKKNYQVSLISMGKIDLEALNQYYGTHLKNNEVNRIEIQIPKLFKNRFDALRSYRLSRYCKKNSDRFDLMILTYNVMDFGKKGIQFIADFSFDDELRRKFDSESKKSLKVFYKKSFLRKFYINFSKWISGESKEGWMKNITVANSKWSAEVLYENYGITADVIYPPVEEDFPDVPWKEKRNGFVAIGRLVPEKRFDRIIYILKRIRERGHDIHFHIIGSGKNRSYCKLLKRIVRENSSWCFLEGQKYGERKRNFLSEHKYGISGRFNEPFGIAPAEMVKSGMIVWVPDGGGQGEIVDHPDLIYKSEEDAVAKIEKVMKNGNKQKELLVNLENQSKKFSTIKFMSEIKNLINNFFEEKNLS